MNICLGRAALAALLTFGAARANAQITTVVSPPPKRNAATQQEVVRREQAAQDSVARVTLTGMTQWVDSAAAALALSRPEQLFRERRPRSGALTSRVGTCLSRQLNQPPRSPGRTPRSSAKAHVRQPPRRRFRR